MMSLQSQVVFLKSIQELQSNTATWYRDCGEVFITITNHNTSAIFTEHGVCRLDQPCFRNFTHTQNANPDPFKFQAQMCYQLSLTYFIIKNVTKGQWFSDSPLLPQVENRTQ